MWMEHSWCAQAKPATGAALPPPPPPAMHAALCRSVASPPLAGHAAHCSPVASPTSDIVARHGVLWCGAVWCNAHCRTLRGASASHLCIARSKNLRKTSRPLSCCCPPYSFTRSTTCCKYKGDGMRGLEPSCSCCKGGERDRKVLAFSSNGAAGRKL